MSFITRTVIRSALAGLVGIVLASSVQAQNISGAGATFPYPVYREWADAYKQETGTGSTISRSARAAASSRSRPRRSTFGASDMPLKPEELKEAGLVQFPMIMGGVVPVVNLKGVKPGQLTLDGPTLADDLHGRDQEVERRARSRR